MKTEDWVTNEPQEIVTGNDDSGHEMMAGNDDRTEHWTTNPRDGDRRLDDQHQKMIVCFIA